MISVAELQKNSRDLREHVRQVEALLSELSKHRLVRTTGDSQK